MFRKIAVSCAFLFSTALLVSVPSQMAQEPNDKAAESARQDDTAALSTQLQELIGNIFLAMNAKDDAKTGSYMKSLVIPNHEKWFGEAFGDEGARLDVQYTTLLNDPREDLREIFEYAIKVNKTVVAVKVLERGKQDVTGLEGAILRDMLRPIPVYVGDAKNDKDEYPVQLGYFVFVDGDFRLVQSRVFQQLSNAPSLRIRMGGNVRIKSLVKRVQPTYPDEARAKGISGTVRLSRCRQRRSHPDASRCRSGTSLEIPADFVKWKASRSRFDG